VTIWVQDIYSLGVKETGATGAGGAALMRKFESFVFRRSDAVVVIHDRFKTVLQDTLHVDAEKIHVIRNWTHLQASVSDRAAYRSKFGWGSETVVLHAGNQGAKQALENVVEAARMADDRRSLVRFVLLGDGNQRELLASLAEGVSRIDFMKSLDDADFQGAMAAADILLVNEKPGVSEMAVPSKLTSYFSARRPVLVATDRNSITAEEIETAGAGIRVDAGNPEALLNEALELGSDPVRSKKYGTAGGIFQSTVLSAETAISEFQSLLQRLKRH
jgi:glycosyltransferase involved in cell wall biosynthesis